MRYIYNIKTNEKIEIPEDASPRVAIFQLYFNTDIHEYPESPYYDDFKKRWIFEDWYIDDEEWDGKDEFYLSKITASTGEIEMELDRQDYDGFTFQYNTKIKCKPDELYKLIREHRPDLIVEKWFCDKLIV